MQATRARLLLGSALVWWAACSRSQEPASTVEAKRYSAAELRSADRVCASAQRSFAELAPAMQGVWTTGTPELSQEQLDAALREVHQELTRCIELNPHQSWPYMSRGDAAFGFDDLDAALADYETAFDISGDPEALYARAYTQAHLGSFAAARADQKLLQKRNARYAEALAEAIYLAEALKRSNEVSRACGVTASATHECEPWEKSFYEAYVTVIYVTPEELAILYPWSVAPDAAPNTAEEYANFEPPAPSEEAHRTAGDLSRRLPRLDCFSVTETEFDALGDVLGLERPSIDATVASPEEQLELLRGLRGALKGAGERLSERPTPPASHLIAARYVPDGCAVIYQLPEEMAGRLSAIVDTDALGVQWNARILANGSNLRVEAFEGLESEANEKADAGDPRDQVEAWQSIARAMHTYAREAQCRKRKLYLRIEYDC